jgi:hypothetical protein
MSFSGKIRDELSRHETDARHCNLAELSAILKMAGEFKTDSNGGYMLRIHTENLGVARKCFTLLEKTFNIKPDITFRKNGAKGCTSCDIYAKGEEILAVQNAVVQVICCKRAYLRGAFLVAGSMSDPSKSYHFEIVCDDELQADYLKELMKGFELDAKVVRRKKNYVVYLKEGAQIVDILNVMEAHVALMEFENIRIMKEMRNSVNRKVNCETANINKTVSAAVRQSEDIKYIQDTIGFEKLSDGLKDVALTRLKYPEATLKELGELLETPLGKSGVNHRLRKLSELAENLKGRQGGTR